ncbi:unnamed protein product [Nippostrongylus brasiliensis]|uniref:Integrase catalytic domain-containing protein n=1 Tax=Nippostrongylus brasiliensis TaxID=27835 RepID=A0A0N4YDB8_NIPBR|nr:unnamed protein product [Nippostrongylus brasiliensis]
MKSSSVNEEELLRTEDMDDENVEQLRYEVEHLGKEPPKETARIESLTDTAIDLDAIDPELLREFAEKKLRARARNKTIVGHRPKLKVRDASGNVMEFLDAIRVTITLGCQSEVVSAYVGRALDDVVILGTNALQMFNMRLQRVEPAKTVELDMCSGTNETRNNKAVVKHRLFVPAKGVGTLTLTGAVVGHGGGAFLQSSDSRISDGLCNAVAEEVIIPVLNNTEEAMVFKTGDIVGEWQNEEWVKPKYVESDKDMMDLVQPKEWSSPRQRCEALLDILQKEQTLLPEIRQIVEKFDDVFAINDRELTQTDLVVHEIDTGDNKPVKQRTRPVPMTARKQFKSIISDLLERGIVEKSSSEENGMTERVIGTLVKMLRKKTVIPAEWDIVLPIVVFAYNCAPHDATGESPFFLLHAADPNYPSNVIPRDELCFNHMDTDDYKHKLLNGIQLAQNCAKEFNEKYREKMKKAYDARNNADSQALPKIGDRVLLKLPREKASKKYPKLVEPWGGPYRIIEVSNNSALISHINEKEEPIRVQFDSLIPIPSEVEDIELNAKTKRVRRRYAAANVNISRVTMRGDGDTEALGLFYQCPGRRRQSDLAFACSIQEKTFKDHKHIDVLTCCGYCDYGGHSDCECDKRDVEKFVDVVCRICSSPSILAC